MHTLYDTPVFQRNFARYKKLKSMHKFAAEIGVNIRYVQEYFTDGIIPANAKIAEAFGYVSKRTVAKRDDRDRLKRIAIDAGFDNWHQIRQAIIDGEIVIPKRPLTN